MSVELMWTQSPRISHKFINTSNKESFLKCDSLKNHKMAHGADLPIYDCYFEFGKSSEVQNKSQMRKLSWMPNVFLNPIQKKFLLKFFLTAFENEAQCVFKFVLSIPIDYHFLTPALSHCCFCHHQQVN